MKNVYLVHGFGAADLGLASNLELVWWDPNIARVLGLGVMRLAANGIDPGPPDGRLLQTSTRGQNPWPLILGQLEIQLDPGEWESFTWIYDWRKSLIEAGRDLANYIRRFSSTVQPGTIVCHSAGGLVALAAWHFLTLTSEQSKIRRIIAMCSPFQGSYAPVLWMTGVSSTVLQLLAMGILPAGPATVPVAFWTLRFLNAIALTWPSFYQLLPSLQGGEYQTDPNRYRLFDASNYPSSIAPDQNWLNSARFAFQPFFVQPSTFPPSWVMTCVYGLALPTVDTLNSATGELDLFDLSTSSHGDLVVTGRSAQRVGALLVGVNGGHSSIPLGLAINGRLAEMIVDPRGPVTPPGPDFLLTSPIAMDVTDPPEADPVSGLVCVGGG